MQKLLIACLSLYCSLSIATPYHEIVAKAASEAALVRIKWVTAAAKVHPSVAHESAKLSPAVDMAMLAGKCSMTQDHATCNVVKGMLLEVDDAEAQVYLQEMAAIKLLDVKP